MPTYSYTAVTKDNKTINGSIEAASREGAQIAIQKQGNRPVIIKEQKSTKQSKFKFSLSSKVKAKDLVIFTRQLSTMINAGVPLARSLTTLQAKTTNKAFREQIIQVCKDIEGGLSFADALEKHPSTFSPIYINMTRAGEAGGILDDILEKLAVQQEKDAGVRAKVKSASTYPLVLLGITVISFFAITILVIPKIGAMLSGLAGPDAKLPPQTQIMLSMSNFMRTYWYIIFALLFGGLFAIRKYIATPKGRIAKDKILLKIPVLKTVIVKVAIARFARIFASLMSAGVSVLEAIEVTSHAIGNSVIEKELLNAASDVKNGRQLSSTIGDSKIFPPIVSQMLAVGEETGQTETVLLKVADFYEEDVNALVSSLSSIIEPVMIVVLGGMVAIIAISVIGPITNLTNSIGSGS